jgi:hypothetical protein
MERQAFVAADVVVVSAHVFVVRVEHHRRAGHQLVGFAARMDAETALAHVADAMPGGDFEEGLVIRGCFAAIVDHRERVVLQEGGAGHGPASLRVTGNHRLLPMVTATFLLILQSRNQTTKIPK